MPAAQAVLSSIVDRTAIGNAVALNSAQYNLLRIVAPAVAGLFIAAGSLALGFWVNAIAHGDRRGPQREPADPQGRAPRASSGRRCGRSSRTASATSPRTGCSRRSCCCPGVPALLVLNYITFFPIYARDILGVGPAGYGLLTGAIGVGAVIGAMSHRGVPAVRRERPARRSAASGSSASRSTTFAVSRSLPLSMLALALLGTFQVSFYSTTNTLIQVLVPSRLRGRVLSLYLLTSIGLIPIGNLVAGAIAEHLGVEVVLGGRRADHGRRGRPGRPCRAGGDAAPSRAPVGLGRRGVAAAAAPGRRPDRLKPFRWASPQG